MRWATWNHWEAIMTSAPGLDREISQPIQTNSAERKPFGALLAEKHDPLAAPPFTVNGITHNQTPTKEYSDFAHDTDNIYW
jgi:hypothetical protein